MRTKYTIKNFRVFDENGVDIDLKPITILTGCNSSGKSSIVKSLLLLCDFFSQIKSAKGIRKIDSLTSPFMLNFMKNPHSSLGKFSNVVNRDSDGEDVTFAIQVHSDILAQDVTVELTFASSDKDDNTNGYCKSLAIKNANGEVVYSSSTEKYVGGNLYALFPEFLRFANMQSWINNCQSIDVARTIGINKETMPDDEFNKLMAKLKENISEYKQKYGRSSLLDLNRWNNAHRNEGPFLRQEERDYTDIFKVMYEKDMVYYLPILNKLHGSKTNTIEFLNQNIAETDDKALISVLKKIVSDFEQTECENFIQYYKAWEEAYLSDFNKVEFPIMAKAPKLFNASGLTMDANDIMMSPYNTETVTLDWENEVSTSTQNKSKEEEIKEWESKPLTFNKVFEAMAILSAKYCPEDNKSYNCPNGYEYMEYSSNTEWLFFKFIELVVEEIIIDATPEAIAYVSSSINNVRRLYTWDYTDNLGTMILNFLNAKVAMPEKIRRVSDTFKRFLADKKNIAEQVNYVPGSFMEKWVKEFLGFDSRITIENINGNGAEIRFHKNSEDKEGSLLADNGYGITQLFAVLLNIEVAIMNRKVSTKILDNNINPLVNNKDMEIVFSSPTVAIEEPEIHLHPSYQSKLADMFIDAYKNYGINLIIETHSEYLIRKLQTLVSGINEKLKISNKVVSIQYVYTPSESECLNEPQIKDIGICKDGYLNDEFGSGFFDEASTLSQQLI